MARKIPPPNEVDPNALPVNPVPPVVWVPAAVIGGLEVVFQAGARGIIGGQAGVGWRNTAINDYGFNDRVFEHMRMSGDWFTSDLLRFFGYSFLHFSLMHAVFGVVLLLAIGNFVARVYPAWAVMLGMAVSSAVGALVFGLVANGGWLIGASEIFYGLMGMMTLLLWLQARAVGQHPIKAFRLLIVLTVLQLAFFGVSKATGNPTLGLAQQIAPTMAAFAAGGLVGWATFPGHLRHLVQRLRQR
ncbi:rhomboid family intramembrane serine protease [Halovulum sp. GXIMD14793]